MTTSVFLLEPFCGKVISAIKDPDYSDDAEYLKRLQAELKKILAEIDRRRKGTPDIDTREWRNCRELSLWWADAVLESDLTPNWAQYSLADLEGFGQVDRFYEIALEVLESANGNAAELLFLLLAMGYPHEPTGDVAQSLAAKLNIDLTLPAQPRTFRDKLAGETKMMIGGPPEVQLPEIESFEYEIEERMDYKLFKNSFAVALFSFLILVVVAGWKLLRT